MNYTKGDEDGWTLPHFALGDKKCQCGYVFYAGGTIADTYCKQENTSKMDEYQKLANSDKPPREEAVGNAILISNAPKMYELLKKFCSSNRMNPQDFKSGMDLLMNMHLEYEQGMKNE